MIKQYKTGIIGFGFIGKVHAWAHTNLPFYYQEIPYKTEITHICTSKQETADKACKIIGTKHGVTDFRNITENPDIDIVHICTPNNLHKEAILSAMENNKHIYCDKPLVVNESEAEPLIKAASTYKGTFGMTFQNRFFPATIRAKDLIDKDHLGRILSFRVAYLHSGSSNPHAPLKWKLSKEAGGGVINDIASHVIDLLYWLLGEYSSLTAESSIAYEKRPDLHDPRTLLPVKAEDSVTILTKMKASRDQNSTEALGTIEASKIATGTEDELRFEIHGSKGALRFNSMAPHYLEYYNQQNPETPVGGFSGWNAIHTGQRYPRPASKFPGPKFSIGWIRTHLACFADFMEKVHSGKEQLTGFYQGLYNQHILECIKESIKSKTWVCPRGNYDFFVRKPHIK